jgi:hypothetical protein
MRSELDGLPQYRSNSMVVEYCDSPLDHQSVAPCVIESEMDIGIIVPGLSTFPWVTVMLPAPALLALTAFTGLAEAATAASNSSKTRTEMHFFNILDHQKEASGG